MVHTSYGTLHLNKKGSGLGFNNVSLLMVTKISKEINPEFF